MTAKQELKELVERLSERDAARLLASLGGHEPGPTLVPGELDGLPPEEREQRLRALFDSWEAEGGYMTDEEWDEFARDFDAQRPHRPLFTA